MEDPHPGRNIPTLTLSPNLHSHMDTHTPEHIHTVIQQTVSAYPIPAIYARHGAPTFLEFTFTHSYTCSQTHADTHSHIPKHTDKSRINVPDKPRNPRFRSVPLTHTHTLYQFHN